MCLTKLKTSLLGRNLGSGLHKVVLDIVLLAVEVDDPRETLLKLDHIHNVAVAAEDHANHGNHWEPFCVSFVLEHYVVRVLSKLADDPEVCHHVNDHTSHMRVAVRGQDQALKSVAHLLGARPRQVVAVDAEPRGHKVENEHSDPDHARLAHVFGTRVRPDV